MKTLEMVYRGVEIKYQDEFFSQVCQTVIGGGYIAFVFMPHGFQKVCGDTVIEIKGVIDEALSVAKALEKEGR